jgi:hypothetical protein
VLVVEAAQELPVNRSRGMPGRLRRPQFTGIAEDGKDIADNGVGEFRVSPRGRPKVPRIAGPIVDIAQDGSVSNVELVAPMPLAYKVLFSSISTFETLPKNGHEPKICVRACLFLHPQWLRYAKFYGSGSEKLFDKQQVSHGSGSRVNNLTMS